jgi:hypothetical protein
MPEPCAQYAQQRVLALAARCETAMTALALKSDPAAAIRKQPGNPQAGARPDRRHRRVGDRCATADLPQLVPAEQRDGVRQCSEIIHHQQPSQAERLAGGLDGKHPRGVGHPHRVAEHRRGDGKCRLAGSRSGFAQKRAGGCRWSGEIRAA